MAYFPTIVHQSFEISVASTVRRTSHGPRPLDTLNQSGFESNRLMVAPARRDFDSHFHDHGDIDGSPEEAEARRRRGLLNIVDSFT
ncbi:hypothetical protein CUR86_13500 [Salinicola acroporae]|uniref:Uncharacterized protein n=1 Tax=Salinicola acroporae TaxID=1541440 RepID=A0ABT6I701_9GAMM|nr:hypothetical protein [Salinicola acroporae]